MDLFREAQRESYFRFRQTTDNAYGNYALHPSIQNILPREKQAQILDIGCGFGQFLKGLRFLGYENIFGVDISQEATNACEKAGLNVDIINDIKSFAENANRKFDFIMMSHILEHIEKMKSLKP